MADFDSVRQTIDASIKQNGTGAITGPVLNGVLNEMVDAADDQVSQLGQKVDDISTGKYYGYYATASDLPEDVAVDGFAYVGSGPTYTIYNCEDGVWTSSGITVNQSPIGNDEDIDQNEDGKLQFANRPNTDGMGYVILRKDKTFAEQVTQVNTIYEIRYTFNLGGASVAIPDGCVLKFDGGNLENGALDLNNAVVKWSKSGIFTDVVFVGDSRYHMRAYLDWFVKEYPANVTDLSIDNTEEVRSAFASGAMNIVFPNKYIHLTGTITITKAISILTENISRKLDSDYKSSGDLVVNTQSPCVYSENIVTLFDYRINVTDEDVRYRIATPFIVDNITLFIYKSFSDTSEKEVPILNIVSDGLIGTLWGIILNCNIKARWSTFTIDGQNDTFQSFTGIRIESLNGAITNVIVNGNIYGTYYGVYCKGYSGNNWFTDVIVNGSTSCCYGGVFDNVGPAIIYGDHQTNTIDHANTAQDEAYFTAPFIKFYGYVWDCHRKSTRSDFYTVALPIKFTRSSYYSTQNVPLTNRASYNIYPNENMHITDVINPNIQMQNGLYRALSPRNPNNFFIWDLSYTIDGTNILRNYTNLKNVDNLFNDNNLKEFASGDDYGSTAARVICPANSTLIISFKINAALWDKSGENQLPKMIWYCVRGSYPYSIRLTDNNNVPIYEYSDVGEYYRGRIWGIKIDDNSANIYNFSLAINFSSATNFVLPTIIVPSYKPQDKICVKSSVADRPNITSGERSGLQCYDLVNKKVNFWSGTGWLDANGNPADALLSGTTSNRPTGVIVGYTYFDTTIGKPIFYKGNNTWVDATGASV